jgi:hypothetical protein
VSGGLAAVDVQRLGGHERRPLEIEDPVDHVDAAGFVPQGMSDAGRDRVEGDRFCLPAALAVFRVVRGVPRGPGQLPRQPRRSGAPRPHAPGSPREPGCRTQPGEFHGLHLLRSLDSVGRRRCRRCGRAPVDADGSGDDTIPTSVC